MATGKVEVIGNEATPKEGIVEAIKTVGFKLVSIKGPETKK